MRQPTPYYRDVEMRDGRGVIDNRIAINPAAFCFDTRYGYDLLGERLAGLLGVDQFAIVMHQCRCGALFVAPQMRRRCQACRVARRRARVAAYSARRSAVRARGRNPSCGRCGEALSAQRGTRRFCSNACRQAAYRERGAGGGSSPDGDD